ncbi:MAG: hypothetical protein C0475_00045 [Planctomyces sp.]|nr:hypothetical protein [Planctomyces sp.]MBA4119320.1 hypothetical protein [Isosphaera sp.]
MTPHDPHTPPAAPLIDPAGRDLLLSRLIDGRATAREWALLRDIARADELVWSELIHTRAIDEALSGVISSRSASAAGAAPLPTEDAPLVLAHRADAAHRASVRAGLAGGAGSVARGMAGWAVAAMLTLAVGMQFLSPAARQGAGTMTSGLGPQLAAPSTPEEAMRSYLELGQRSGQVLGEMNDRMVISATPNPDGSVEVIFVRPIIERARLEQLQRLGTDETGRSITIPLWPGQFAQPGSDPI